MTRIYMDIIEDAQGFLNEIIRNHGKGSMQYVWAVATVKEVRKAMCR